MLKIIKSTDSQKLKVMKILSF